MRTAAFLLALAALTTAASAAPFETVEFPSADGLTITGDLYAPHPKEAPFLLLCHQARWSRGEYRETAPKLNALGFNCLAIDQRSGGTVGGVDNQTFARAEKKGLKTTYLDARPDIVAGLKYARAYHAKGKLIAVGSSYSSALVLQIVGTDATLADGVISFAPGEYFQRFGQSATYIRDGAKGLKCPVFITSAKREKPAWEAIYAAIPSDKKAMFLPETAGNHGARALWKQFGDSPAYWKALTAFLDAHFPRKK